MITAIKVTGAFMASVSRPWLNRCTVIVMRIVKLPVGQGIL